MFYLFIVILKARFLCLLIGKLMEYLSKIAMRRICKILIEQDGEEKKKLKKYKVANGNVKKYNKIAQLKLKEKIRNEKLSETNKKIKMFDAIKRMKVNVKDEDYKVKSNCEEEDEDIQVGRIKRFNCDFEGCKKTYQGKGKFTEHFISHFTGEIKCEQCNATFTFKSGLENHLLVHENKRKFKCPHEGCNKTFNTEMILNQHKLVHLQNKLYQCNYCSFKTNRRENLDYHIKAKHMKQDLVKCNWPGCNKKMVKKCLNLHLKRIHQNTNQFKCISVNCTYVTKHKFHLTRHLKNKHNEK